jgi:6-phosphogluconolactonase (cycloisomerase 2 family)
MIYDRSRTAQVVLLTLLVALFAWLPIPSRVIALANTPANFVYVSNGRSISAFSVAADGTLNEVDGSPFATGGVGGGGWAVFDQIVISPSGKFLYVANSSSGNVSGFSINPTDGRLTPIPGSPFMIAPHPQRVSPSFSPRSLAVSRDERFLFVAEDVGAGISSFRIAGNGALTHIQSLLPYYRMSTRIWPSNDGRFLFTGEAFSSWVYAIDIDPSGKVLGSSKPPYRGPMESGAVLSEMNCALSLLFQPDYYGLTVLRVSPQAEMTQVSGSPFADGVVGSYNRIVLNPAENYLFTANLESTKISTLSVTPAGNVSLVTGSTFSIGDPNNEDRRPVDIGVSADGRWVYVMSADSTIYIFGVSSGGLLTPVPGSPFTNRGGSGYGATIATYPPKACGPVFDRCVQDESNGNLLQINTTTGDYQFSNCAGLAVGGTGMLTKRGSLVTLQNNASDRRVMAMVDTATGKATASVQLLSQGATFSIMDRNIANNTCACR